MGAAAGAALAQASTSLSLPLVAPPPYLPSLVQDVRTPFLEPLARSFILGAGVGGLLEAGHLAMQVGYRAGRPWGRQGRGCWGARAGGQYSIQTRALLL